MDEFEQSASLLKTMGHPVRLQILNMLRAGEICVCHIERALNKRQAYVSQQLMVLRDAGLVESRKDGLQVFYRLDDEQAVALLEVVCGPAEDAELEKIPGCTCPICTTVMIAEIN